MKYILYSIICFSFSFLAEPALVQVRCLASVLCCSALCLSMVGLQEINQARNDFQSMRGQEQTQWFLDYMRVHSKLDGQSYAYTFIVGTTAVCATAWSLVLGISRTKFYRLKKQFEGMLRGYSELCFLHWVMFYICHII